ncbi:hypothetical protein [Burkholderia sp. FL-7-2-10-S1-D7]|uniref:hypothetical protein n=1 Tax=Burkholderia sp. FL-7-2-10-S1-D7 TaxID=1637866 RepID=UPI0012E3A41D|nr:hypothetical protein [Burkholderia sp. FL-7-2-10-S1-D7]
MVVILRGDAIHRIEAVPRGFDRDQRVPAARRDAGDAAFAGLGSCRARRVRVAALAGSHAAQMTVSTAVGQYVKVSDFFISTHVIPLRNPSSAASRSVANTR